MADFRLSRKVYEHHGKRSVGGEEGKACGGFIAHTKTDIKKVELEDEVPIAMNRSARGKKCKAL